MPADKSSRKPWTDSAVIWATVAAVIVGSAVVAGVLFLIFGVFLESGDEDSAMPTRLSETPSATPSATVPAAPISQPVVGQPQTSSTGVKATPIALVDPATLEPDPHFARTYPPLPWTVLDAELCATSAPVYKTDYGFTLIDSQNREYKKYTEHSPAEPFKPTIGPTGDLAPGECARGYVTFALPEGVDIVAVRWDYPGGGGPLRWALQ